MTAPPVSPSRRDWEALVRVARAIPAKAKQRMPTLTAKELEVISELIDEALAEAETP